MNYNIPNGPHDAPFLFINPQDGDRIVYDVSDTIGTYFMLNHDLKGCLAFFLSKDVIPDSGTVTLDGEPIDYVVSKVRIRADIEGTMLGIRLAGRVVDYGSKAQLSISGFTDFDGNVMLPRQLEVVTEPQAKPLPQYAEHEAVALQAAEEGIVLLKNEDHALPLTNPVLNVVGEGLYFFQTCAVGAGKNNPRYQIDFRQAVMDDHQYTLNEELAAFVQRYPNIVPEDDLLNRAAEQSDTVIMILVRPSGENMDNSTAPGEYQLSEQEKALLQALNRHFAKVVLVLNTGYPVAMDFTDTIHVSAIVYNGFGGMLAGTALLNVLTGRTTPSGRLTDSWVKTYQDQPTADYFYDCYQNDMQRYAADDGPELATHYEEGVFMGYRYFMSCGKEPFYPFGYGLSYTTFSEKVQEVIYQENKGVSVTVTVKNEGAVPGKQVVQLYIRKPETALMKPTRELMAFGKTRTLNPGEEETVTLFADVRHLHTFSEQAQAYLLEAGLYQLYLGDDAQHVRAIGSFEIRETIMTRKTNVRMTGKRAAPGYADQPLYPGVDQMAVKDMIRLSVCAGDGWGMEGTGEAGRVHKIDSLPMADYIATDGNSGINLKQRNIGMPSGACFASSFNAELVRNVGRVIGEEGRELGVGLVLGPGFNLHRNPLCGRNPEYFSEDPYLAGMLAAAYAEGVESTGVHACYKHLVANNTEVSRKRNDSVMDESTLRNLYLRAFEIALSIYQPASVMTSYNLLNGCYTCNDPELILGVLRQEWGFQGYVMTDWSSYDTADLVEMVNAGVSWITPGSSDDTFTARLEQAAQEGTLDIRRLRENVSYLLKTIMK